jgi:Zn-dependent protease
MLQDLIFYLPALVLAVTLHEFAHAWTSHMLGDTTASSRGRLSLNPAAHIDPFATLLLPLMLILMRSPVIFGAAKPVPFNPWAVRYGKWGAVLVALAGPATNLLLACLFALWLNLLPLGAWAATFALTMVTVNAAFFVFNMIPFPPLDGSRLLYAVAPQGVREVMDRIEQTGLMAVFVLLLLAGTVISPFVGRMVGIIVGILLPGFQPH